ncbi:hypothetical protein [Reyranella sp.]|uniref:hypothetical protein n=1 Tax=Reyranella sp. TaxID=1929291 RepID=UPI004035F2A7
MRIVLAILVLTVICIAPVPGTGELRAATIVSLTASAPTTLFSRTVAVESPRLRLTGMIESGDAERLRELLDKLRELAPQRPGMPLATIELSSVGGDLSEGVRIGELLKNYRVVAVVRKQDLCLSACALALLGGNTVRTGGAYPFDCNVEVGGKVAFHNFFLDRSHLRRLTSDDPIASRLQGFADGRSGAAMLIKYAADMGLPPSFAANLMARPVEEFQYVETIGEFLALNLCPIGLERPRLPLSHQAANVCNNSLATPAPLSSVIVGQIEPPRVRQYMLERVQDGLNAARARGKLADQLATWSVMRSKEEVERLYDDLRAAGVALPEIVGQTFEVAVNEAGRVRAACYVSLSSTDPDRYEVVLQGTRGLTEAVRKPPANARRLFLYDRQAVANRRPPSDDAERVAIDIEDRQTSPLGSRQLPTRDALRR